MDNVLPAVGQSSLSLSFDLIATVPSSSGAMPFARVQEVLSVPDLPDTYAALDTRGVIWLIEDGEALETPLLDLRTAGIGFTDAGAEAGLRSFAFHPDFANEGTDGYGKIYVAYSASVASHPDGVPLFEADGASNIVFHDVISEFTVSDPANPVIIASTERELFRVEQPFGNHNFGQMRFRPDAEPGDDDYGLLYLGIGDGGSGNDPLNAGEDLSQILGKILRIDPLDPGGDETYSIPTDNPFTDTTGALPEIYAYGFRNPQSLSWLGDIMFAGDIGQNAVEELDIVFAGGNYGWDDREGSFLAGGGALPANDADLGYQYPFTQYDHEEIPTGGEGIFGGFAYQGSDIPGLEGQLLFANFPTGEVFVVSLDDLSSIIADGLVASDEYVAPLRVTIIGEDGEETTFLDFEGTGNPGNGRVDLRFALTDDGEILVFSKQTGNIYQLTSAADDELSGTAQGEIIRAGAGDDLVDAGAGNDTIYGVIGSDTLIGGDGNDLIIGDDGRNLIYGDSAPAAAASAAAQIPATSPPLPSLPETLPEARDGEESLLPFEPLTLEIPLF